MERVHRNRLDVHRQSIVDDLEVIAISDVLVQRGVFSQDQIASILLEKTDHDQVRKLLDMLPNQGPEAFNIFVDILKSDYDWLAEKLESTDCDDLEPCADDLPSEILDRMLLKGGVPHPLSHQITREEKLGILKEKLGALKPGNFLVLHGTPGSGKSVLAAEALRDPTVSLTHFPDGVFWFRVGMLDEKKLLERMQIFCEKLDAPTKPTSIEHSQEILRELFLSKRYSKSLLILDDVWSSFVINTFNLTARVLVTTRDLTVMEDAQNCMEIIDIQSGFTKEESMALFSSYVSIPKEFLPDEALEIHKECKGSPMVISLIGSLISETGNKHSTKQRESGRWSHYLFNLKSRHMSRIRKQSGRKSISEHVMSSVRNLEEPLRHQYQSLAVFLDHHDYNRAKSERAEIKTTIRIGGQVTAENKLYYEQMCYKKGIMLPYQVLMTYWNMSAIEVEDTMDQFQKKSLASSEFDPTLQTLVFTMNSFIFGFYVAQLENEKELHRNFLHHYFEKVDYKDYGDIADDSYIFANLGHHLVKAEMFHLFPEIYLNLKFVGAMIKANGQVDLLNDFKRFETHIIGEDDANVEALENFEKFVRTIGFVMSQNPSIDIVQLALKEPESSRVYQAAKAMALSHQETLYFDWTNREGIHQHHMATILHHGSVQSAIFLKDITKILTCNGDGQIKMWNVLSGEILHRFTGHKEAVLCLALSPDGDLFASGSKDGSVKIWDLGNFLDDLSGPEMNPPKQRKHKNTLGRTKSIRGSKPNMTKLITADHDLRDLSNQSFLFQELNHDTVLFVDFNADGTEVIASSLSGTVKVFNLRARRLRLTLIGHHEPVNVCRFLPETRYICTGSDDATIRVWNMENGEFLSSNGQHLKRVTDLAFVPKTHKIISLSSDSILLWDLDTLSAGQRDFPAQDSQIFQRTRQCSFTKMCLTSNGERLVAASEDFLITIWDVLTTQVIAALPGHSGLILTMDISELDDFLLSGGADETIMIWSLEDLTVKSKKQIISLGPAFDAKLDHSGNWRIVAPDDTNRIQILKNEIPQYNSTSEGSLITAVSLSDDAETVAFGCLSGAVRMVRPSEGLVKALGSHTKRVNDVKINFDGRIVASAGDDGVLMIFYDGFKSAAIKTSQSSLLAVHFIRKNDSVILTRSAKNNVVTWNLTPHLDPDPQNTHCPDGNYEFTYMDGCEANNMLSLGCSNGVVSLLTLDNLSHISHLEFPTKKNVPVTVCKFNVEGNLLAVGYDARFRKAEQFKKQQPKSFTVVIWSTGIDQQLQMTLKLDGACLRDIAFSHDSRQLVTAGDKIAWWSLKKMTKQRPSMLSMQNFAIDELNPPIDHCSRRISQGNIFQRSSKQFGTEDEQTYPNQSPRSPRADKICVSDLDHLLQLFDIKGSSVSRIFPAKDFRKFATIDDAGDRKSVV